MNQIYHFDSYSPPLLNEAMLRRERERRREQRAIAAAATAANIEKQLPPTPRILSKANPESFFGDYLLQPEAVQQFYLVLSPA